MPESHLEAVKKACFKQGAGKTNQYENCCWQTLGQEQFQPKEGSQPYIGSHNKLHTLEAFKVEMLCAPETIHKVLEAFIDTHPFEEPAYEIYEIKTINDFSSNQDTS